MLATPRIIATAVGASVGFAVLANAGFSSSTADNVAVYWGQNSYQQPTGSLYSQQRLSYYCSDTNIDIIPLAFLDAISTPVVNFANAGDNCTAFSGTTLLSCSQLEEDIQTCQSTYGKTILLSVGGATYTEGGFSTSTAATAAADNIWAMFGPVQTSSSVNRPFGNAVVDGFDFDFESSTSNMAAFAEQLRASMDAATAAGGKEYYLSAAPQCPYPDVADNDMLSGAVYFDFIMVQFYNNYCGLQSFVSGSSSQNNFDFSTWDTWAQSVSKNPDVRILVGIPGSSTAAGSGYESGSTLASIVTYLKQFPTFGGIMIWDMSQVYANSGLLDAVVADLKSAASTTTATTVPLATPTTSPTKPTSETPPSSPRAAITPTGTIPAEMTPTEALTTESTQIAVTQTAAATGLCTQSTIVSTTTVTVTVTGDSATTPTIPTNTTFTTKTTSATQTAKPVSQWGQCGGTGYTGSTTCASPYSCVILSVWWAQCE
ncbi:aminotransferase class 3 [Grosmannia clavigera kw1407]|uniref:chitinase n=1 Tax=Grosmannia clavigera (strain kw1407 / UAMH 11150) TaxID=655863 RepID=F0XIV1_GROCL|nr:aminotransferase class 3 [Grosmannia clavigera kw1407]EFX02333.1 aminotransferase class 3 [Grosmannia clavigera kw1407]